MRTAILARLTDFGPTAVIPVSETYAALSDVPLSSKLLAQGFFADQKFSVEMPHDGLEARPIYLLPHRSQLAKQAGRAPSAINRFESSTVPFALKLRIDA